MYQAHRLFGEGMICGPQGIHLRATKTWSTLTEFPLPSVIRERHFGNPPTNLLPSTLPLDGRTLRLTRLNLREPF